MEISEYIKDIVGGKSFSQLVKYGVVGVATNLIGYLVYLAITYMGAGPKITMSFLYAIGIVISFVANRSWSFTDNRGLSDSAKLYLVTYIIGYLINLSIMFVFIDIYGFKHYFVQLAATFVMPFYYFILLKLFVFKD